MKYSAALSLLFLLPRIHAAALPQLFGSELESTSSTLKRDTSGKLVPRSPQHYEIEPNAVTSMTDDSSLNPSSNVKRDLSARSPQGPASNPGEFPDIALGRFNPANLNEPPRDHHNGSSSSVLIMEEAADMGHLHNHNRSRHHSWNATRHDHRKEGILTEFNSHGEHIVVYNGTHYPNGTSYKPANTTMNGGQLLEKVIVAGDEVVVYRRPWNETRHHRHHHNQTVGSMPTMSGVWLPSGTGWIPSSTGRPRHHRKVPSPSSAGFRGPKSRKDRKGEEYFVEEIIFEK